MSSATLNFLGGLFVFLAALIPILKGIWRLLRRKLRPRALILLPVALLNLALMVLWLIGHSQHWQPTFQIFLLFCYIMGSTLFFIADDRPVSRFDIGFWVLTISLASALLSNEIRIIEEQHNQPKPPTTSN